MGVEEGAVHAADPLGGFGGGAAGGGGVGELVAEGLDFGFEVVEGGEQHGFGGHGELGAAEFELAVVGEDHVLDEEAEVLRERAGDVYSSCRSLRCVRKERGVLRGRREFGLCRGLGVEGRDFFVEEALGDRDVADELAFEGVVERAAPGELADFADVVEDGSGEEEVGVYLGVKRCGGEAEADEVEDVLEEASDPGVVEALGGGGFEEGRAKGGVVEEGEDEAAEVGVGEGGDVAAELGGHGGDVVLGGGDEVCRVDFGGCG